MGIFSERQYAVNKKLSLWRGRATHEKSCKESREKKAQDVNIIGLLTGAELKNEG